MPEPRSRAIDVAKGCAILAVILIHSELFVPSLLQTYAINRAVPVFLVLFGITSALWWEKIQPPGRYLAWYRSRFARLMPAYWLAVLFWWSGQRLLSSHPVGLDALGVSLAAYAPWIQTSWFVSAIVQLILLFPLLRLAVTTMGATAATLAALALMSVSHCYAFEITAWLDSRLPYAEVTSGFYPFWIFVPQYFWLVVCGMQMTRIAHAPSAAAAIVAFFVVFLGVAAAGAIEAFVTLPWTLLRIVTSFADPALALLLLATSQVLARSDLLRRGLSWLGKNSWEIYVGQMAVHSLASKAWERAGGPLEHRIEYTLVLLIGGVGFAFALAEARRRVSIVNS